MVHTSGSRRGSTEDTGRRVQHISEGGSQKHHRPGTRRRTAQRSRPEVRRDDHHQDRFQGDDSTAGEDQQNACGDATDGTIRVHADRPTAHHLQPGDIGDHGPNDLAAADLAGLIDRCIIDDDDQFDIPLDRTDGPGYGFRENNAGPVGEATPVVVNGEVIGSTWPPVGFAERPTVRCIDQDGVNIDVTEQVRRALPIREQIGRTCGMIASATWRIETQVRDLEEAGLGATDTQRERWCLVALRTCIDEINNALEGRYT